MDFNLNEYLLEYITATYEEELIRAVTEEREAFEIDFQNLSGEAKTILNKDYIEHVNEGTTIHDIMKDIFNQVARESGKVHLFKDVLLQFKNVTPHRKIREIDSEDINGLLRINGIAISITPPQSIMTKAHFRCGKCDEEIIVPQSTTELVKPRKCLCGAKRGFNLLEARSEYSDYQEIIIQENPEEVTIGVVPRVMRARTRGKQLLDSCKPGDVVDLVCALTPIPSKRSGKARIFSWILEVNNVEVLSKDSYSVELTEADIIELQYLATDPNIIDRLTYSTYPSIWGHEEEKLGLMFGLFGGVNRKRPDINQRGTINVLLIGDPSTAKSQMLIATVNAAPKGIYTSGKGSSGVGLTAAAVQDDAGWRLEAGSLVLADGGICGVDEIEKMSNEDRSKIHEAMSKQTVTIDKATIHMTLNARTGIMAAANPTKGRYDENDYLTENISLPPTILSRFDLIFIIRDIPNEEDDRAMGEKILNVDKPEEELELIDRQTLKKYILYARSLNPKLTSGAIKKILDYYVPLRQQSGEQSNNPIAIAPRQLEGLRRLAEARARLSLEEEVTIEHAEMAIELMRGSLEKAGYDPKTGKVDINILEVGKPQSREERRRIVVKLLETADEPLLFETLAERAEQYGVDETELRKFLRIMLRDGDAYTPTSGVWLHTSNTHLYKWEE